MSIVICRDCERYIDTDFHSMGEDEICEECAEVRFQSERAYWKPRYDGEKLAGLLPANHYK